MLHRRRRLVARLLAISLLAATLFAADSLSSPSPAQARCAGANTPLRSTYSVIGKVRVSETAGFDTCDGNNFYTGVLKDELVDGYCVDVEFANGTSPGPWYSVASVCGAGNTVSFSWEDSNHNSQLWEQLCIYKAGGDFNCGWGTESGGVGLNYGF